MDAETIELAYRGLREARAKLFDAAEEVINYRYELEAARLKAVADGVITGKNEGERKAAEHALFHSQLDHLAWLEGGERGARLDYENALAQVEMVRALLRLAELTARAEV